LIRLTTLALTGLLLAGCYSRPPTRHIERGNYGGAVDFISGGMLTVVIHMDRMPSVKAKIFLDGMEWGETSIYSGSDIIEHSEPCSLIGQRRLEVRFFKQGATYSGGTSGSGTVTDNTAWLPYGPVFSTQVEIAAGRETVVDMYAKKEHVDLMSVSMRETTLASTSQSMDSSSQRAAPATLESPVDTVGVPGRRRTDTWALVVGIEAYRDIPPAKFAENDARAFMLYAAAVMGIPEENTRLMLNDRATRTDLHIALTEWLPRNIGAGDRVIVFWSGHGAPDPDTNQGYLVPYDGNPNYLSASAYPVSDVIAQLSETQAAEVVVMLDACFSGTGPRSLLPDGARPLMLEADIGGADSAGESSVVVLTATGPGQIAMSRHSDEHGLFTYHLLDGMKDFKADTNRDGRLQLDELFGHLGANVPGEANRQGFTQHPTLFGNEALSAFEIARRGD